MKRAYRVALAALVAVVMPLPVAAANATWPQGCVADVAGGDKQAIKAWEDSGFSGEIEVECGTVWDGVTNDNATADSNFGENGGAGDPLADGSIERMLDRMSSLFIFNRSQFGVCFLFFNDASYQHFTFNAGNGHVWGQWLSGKPEGSKHRWKSFSNLQPSLNTPLTPWNIGDTIQSFVVVNSDAEPSPGFGSINTAQECQDYGNDFDGEGAGIVDSGVVW